MSSGVTTPPPPKHGGANNPGPSTAGEWVDFYRWLFSQWRAVNSASGGIGPPASMGISPQSIIPPQGVNPAAFLQGLRYAPGNPPLAAGSLTAAGILQPDGTTITVNRQGVISTAGGGSIPAAQKYTTSWTGQTSVTVTHNLGTLAVIPQVFDASGNVVIPQNLQITGVNTLVLTFGVSFTGSVVVIAIGAANLPQVYSTSWTAQTSVTVTHNLGSASVFVIVYDASGDEVVPQQITITSSNVVTLTFGVSFTGSVVVLTLTGPARQVNVSWTSQTSVTITHDLGTTAVVIQVYDASGHQVIPQNATATDANTVTLTFGASFTGSASVMG